jgi:hypothetical protein
VAPDNNAKLVLLPTYSSWLNRIESHFAAMRSFVISSSDYPDRARAARYIDWRNHHRHDPSYAAPRSEAAFTEGALVRETGVTMRALRACNWLYVGRELIDAGELDDAWIPWHWTPEWTAQVLGVLAAVDPRRGPKSRALRTIR